MRTPKLAIAACISLFLFLTVKAGGAAGSSFARVPSFIVNSQATKISGNIVENTDGEKLGKIKDLLVSLPGGEVQYVLVNTGGILGVASHTKVVPARVVSLATAKQRTASVDIPLPRWKDAPQFKRKNMAELADFARYSQIVQYYASSVRSSAREIKPTGATQHALPGARTNSAWLVLASELIGKRVIGAQQESIGFVSDLLVDLEASKPSFAIIAAQRHLRKDYTFAAALGSLTPASSGRLIWSIKPADLDRARGFNPRVWAAPEPNAIYRYVLLDADNTALNARDRNGDSIIPDDQSESERDLQITRRLRQQLVSDEQLTFTAKNVKIITINGYVTLRGPVKRAAEKQLIQQKAELIAGNGRVENLLEVENEP